jgi:Flp pilus assembly pilin Flp
MRRIIIKLILSCRGATGVEYALALAAVGTGTIAALTLLGDEIKAVYETLAAALQ